MFQRILYQMQYQVQYLINPHKFYPMKPVDKHVLDDPSGYIDCTDLDPYNVLAHLYNSSKPMGLGVIQAKYVAMDHQTAKDILDSGPVTDYIYGRPIKVSFENWPFLYPGGYDQKNGHGMMQKLINELRETGTISTKIPENNPKKEFDRMNTEIDQFAKNFADHIH